MEKDFPSVQEVFPLSPGIHRLDFMCSSSGSTTIIAECLNRI